MLELFFFILGLVDNVFLIFIFLVRKTHKMATLQRIGVGLFTLGDSSGLWDFLSRTGTESGAIWYLFGDLFDVSSLGMGL